MRQPEFCVCFFFHFTQARNDSSSSIVPEVDIVFQSFWIIKILFQYDEIPEKESEINISKRKKNAQRVDAFIK